MPRVEGNVVAPWTARLVAAALWGLAAVGAWAEEPCAVVLRDAERFYQEGRIAYVYPVREACIESKATRAEQVRAWAVLARAYVADDKLGRAAEAVETLIALDPEFSPVALDSIVFARMVEREKQKLTATARVATVSKVDEPLREAPATVIVLTAEDIERRGYLDLEEIFHDLPGFDISRGNGDVYSNIYMRGYRSDRSDRMMLLIDGIEQNDLHSNTAYISRQYPLSNIDHIEVVYGPASTIYGPNAFNGVISITTRPPVAFLDEGRNFGYSLSAGGGSFGTGFFDGTVAGRLPRARLSWSVTARSFRSDEQDLSRFPEWDYRFELPDLETYRELLDVFGEDLTMEDLERARQLDQGLIDLLQRERGGLLNFSDDTDDWYLSGKLQIEDFTLGFQTWRREEGTAPWYTELQRAGTGNVLTPKQTNLYLRYARRLGASLSLTILSRFKEHELDGGSSASRFALYANRFYSDFDLSFRETPFFERIEFDQISTQVRTEATLVYQPSARFNIVSGVELRNSSVQADFVSEAVDRVLNEQDLSLEPFFFLEATERRELRFRDAGIFAQISFRLVERLKVVVGGRLDDNSIRRAAFPLDASSSFFGDTGFNEAVESCGGFPEIDQDFDDFFECIDEFLEQIFTTKDFGTIFNGRLALIYSFGDFLFKGIYSEAFKDATNFQKFTREPTLREVQNPLLESEEVENLELAFSWKSVNKISLEVVGYESSYSQVVSLRRQAAEFIPPTITAGFENTGALRVRGLQGNFLWRSKRFQLFGNYTYTDPSGQITPVLSFFEDPPDEATEVGRVGDIARHRLNLGVHLPLGRSFDLSLRANYVSARETGEGTTVPTNPFDEIDSYFVANGTLTYKMPRFLPGATWQLVVRNLFDSEYFHPGVQLAGQGFASRLPQPGRAVYVRFLLKR